MRAGRGALAKQTKQGSSLLAFERVATMPNVRGQGYSSMPSTAPLLPLLASLPGTGCCWASFSTIVQPTMFVPSSTIAVGFATEPCVESSSAQDESSTNKKPQTNESWHRHLSAASPQTWGPLWACAHAHTHTAHTDYTQTPAERTAQTVAYLSRAASQSLARDLELILRVSGCGR